MWEPRTTGAVTQIDLFDLRELLDVRAVLFCFPESRIHLLPFSESCKSC